MNRTGQSHPRARRALWLGGLLLTLAGLLGMHGLAGRGTETGSTLGAGSSVSAAPVAAVVSASSRHDHDGGTGMDMGGTAMCLAVLLVTALALVALGQARGSTSLVLVVARPTRAPAVRGRAPDPPDLHALSVQRC